jgi:hypothetical protein
MALGDGLLAISQELKANPEANSHSLTNWLTWLDQQGYN